MRQFGLTYDDAIDLQASLTYGLKSIREVYDLNQSHTAMSRKIAKTQTKRAMKKIAFLNGFTKAKTKEELRELGKLVVE